MTIRVIWLTAACILVSVAASAACALEPLEIVHGQRVEVHHLPERAELAQRLADALDEHYLLLSPTAAKLRLGVSELRPALLDSLTRQLGVDAPPAKVRKVVENIGTPEQMARIAQMVDAMAKPQRILLLENEQIKQRLREGDLIENFTYDAVADEATYNMNLGLSLDQAIDPKAARDYLLPVDPGKLAGLPGPALAEAALQVVQQSARSMALPYMIATAMTGANMAVQAHLLADRRITSRWFVEAAALLITQQAAREVWGERAASMFSVRPADHAQHLAEVDLSTWRYDEADPADHTPLDSAHRAWAAHVLREAVRGGPPDALARTLELLPDGEADHAAVTEALERVMGRPVEYHAKPPHRVDTH